MTKVTVEMLGRFERDELAWTGKRGALLDVIVVEREDLAALVALCRRVIEPGEDVVERCAREFADRLGFGWDTLNEDWENDAADPILTRKDFRDSARAVLASLTQGEGGINAD